MKYLLTAIYILVVTYSFSQKEIRRFSIGVSNEKIINTYSLLNDEKNKILIIGESKKEYSIKVIDLIKNDSSEAIFSKIEIEGSFFSANFNKQSLDIAFISSDNGFILTCITLDYSTSKFYLKFTRDIDYKDSYSCFFKNDFYYYNFIYSEKFKKLVLRTFDSNFSFKKTEIDIPQNFESKDYSYKEFFNLFEMNRHTFCEYEEKDILKTSSSSKLYFNNNGSISYLLDKFSKYDVYASFNFSTQKITVNKIEKNNKVCPKNSLGDIASTSVLYKNYLITSASCSHALRYDVLDVNSGKVLKNYNLLETDKTNNYIIFKEEEGKEKTSNQQDDFSKILQKISNNKRYFIACHDVTDSVFEVKIGSVENKPPTNDLSFWSFADLSLQTNGLINGNTIYSNPYIGLGSAFFQLLANNTQKNMAVKSHNINAIIPKEELMNNRFSKSNYLINNLDKYNLERIALTNFTDKVFIKASTEQELLRKRIKDFIEDSSDKLLIINSDLFSLKKQVYFYNIDSKYVSLVEF